MGPSNKNAAAAKDRRKSNNTTAPIAGASQPSKIVALKVPSEKLRAIVDPDYVKEDSPVKESPATSNTLPAPTGFNTENASDSSPNTPATGTPAPPSVRMGPPAEGPKKKGVKRGAAALANGEPKIRGKPGPKKKQRLEDGTIEGGRASLGGHKLGPKANQGAINAGLRALDRSGKPCRKWDRGGFRLKSFTGVVWEIPRWKAPPKPLPETSTDSSAPVSVDGSTKENKEDNSQQVKSDSSNNGGDVEMASAPPSIAAANSPVPPPVPIAAA